MNERGDPNVTTDLPSTPANSPRAAEPVRTADHVAGVVTTDESSAEADGQGGDLPEVPGYRVLREIARGGMGRVLAAYDLGLDRDVALKVLLPGAHADRFVRESKITARLPHPGIPPVHALGTLADGSPFLAMKLIAGQTLGDEMKTADRPRLVQAFLQVCQAVGFAHSRGIIHRDLKPANVMVGAFGEVQVMDWGLAKEVDDGRLAAEERQSRERKRPEEGTDPNRTTDYAAAGDSPDERTRAGTVLGTPAYMAPEQARGEAADARADVFALGGILCAILIGHPPYRGQTARDVIRRAGAADLGETLARLDRCGEDAELVALCRVCLSPNPADRPADGQAVADALSSYLNGVQERLQAAQRERAVAVAREAEQRKRRKVQLALAAAVVGLLLGGGAFAWWRNEQAQLVRQRQARNAEAVAALLGQAEQALKARDAAKALVALEAAKKRSAEGGAEQQAQRLRGLDADLTLVRELDAVDQFRWTPSESKYPDAAAVATRTRKALARFGADPDAVPVEEAAARVSASVVRERIVSALDRLLHYQKTAAVRALLRRVDADAYRDAVREVVLARASAKMAALAGRPAALEQPPGFVAFLGAIPVIPMERRRTLLAAALSRRPGDLDLLMTLGGTYPVNREDGANERLRWYQAAVAAAPAMPAAHNGLGIALRDKKDHSGAEAAFRKAIELAPKNAIVRSNLGNALLGKGQADEAIACFKKAIALDPNSAVVYANLGAALKDKGEVDEAIASLRKAIALDRTLALAHNNLGVALIGKGQVEKAIACYKKAIALDRKYAAAHYNLGAALKAKGQVDEAIGCFQKALELDPKFANAHLILGVALHGKGQLDEAIACYRKAIAVEPKLAKAYGALGEALLDKGRYAEARDATSRALELLPDKDPLRAFVSRQLQTCQRFVRLEARLPRLLARADKPTSAGECLDVVALCRHKRMHAAAARFTAEAFAADPKLGDDLRAAHRYNAACHAALAAAGQGADAAKLDGKDKARLRQQALDWLRADLALRTKQLASGQPAGRAAVRQALGHWQKDGDLAGIRDREALAKLPPEERLAYERLWADVAALLKKAETPAGKDGK